MRLRLRTSTLALAALLLSLLLLCSLSRGAQAAWALQEHWDDEREALDAAFFRKENREEETYYEQPGFVHTHKWRTSASNSLPERYGYFTYDPGAYNPERRSRVYRPRQLKQLDEWEIWDDACGVAVTEDRIKKVGRGVG